MADGILKGTKDLCIEDVQALAKGDIQALEHFRRDLGILHAHSANETEFAKNLVDLNDTIGGKNLLPDLYVAGLNSRGQILVAETSGSRTDPTPMGVLVDERGMINVRSPLDSQVANIPLFNHSSSPISDISSRYIEQGNLGDCNFESALGQVADRNPASILSMISDNRDNTFTVTFPGDRAHPLTVERPSDWELREFSGARSGIWAAVLEKAYRKYMHRQLVDQGLTYPYLPLSLLTGQSIACFDVKDEPAPADAKVPALADALKQNGNFTAYKSQIPDLLRQGVEANDAILAGSRHWDHLGDQPSRGQVFTHVDGIPVPAEIDSNHEYGVRNYYDRSSTVTMQNPWNRNKLSDGSRVSRGEIELPAGAFAGLFDHLCFSPTGVPAR